MSHFEFDEVRLAQAVARERARFIERTPRSRALADSAARHLLFGVPLHWMRDWPTPYSLFVDHAKGAMLTDVDGNRYVDFCLGDTGAMFGHSPAPIAQALTSQSARGLTSMLPTADSIAVSGELARRFGLPTWQFALSATDANRFVLRWVRAITGRSKILVFNGCYHGTVDDTLVDLVDGQTRTRASLLGQVNDLTAFTRVVEFNDLTALEAALSDSQVACLLAEPAMTNVGMVLPDPGFWVAAQKLLRRHGTLLVVDETHTISSAWSGAGAEYGLEADFIVLGKPLAGGLPGAAYGFSTPMAAAAEAARAAAPAGHSGIGTTLAAGMMVMAAMRANLEAVMTESAYHYMQVLADRLGKGLDALIRARSLPWCVTRLGARTELQFCPAPPANGSAARAIHGGALEAALQLHLTNRGILITPFHNMMLVCPDTKADDVDALVGAIDEFASSL